jgi:hypothetical protein
MLLEVAVWTVLAMGSFVWMLLNMTTYGNWFGGLGILLVVIVPSLLAGIAMWIMAAFEEALFPMR